MPDDLHLGVVVTGTARFEQIDAALQRVQSELQATTLRISQLSAALAATGVPASHAGWTALGRTLGNVRDRASELTQQMRSLQLLAGLPDVRIQRRAFHEGQQEETRRAQFGARILQMPVAPYFREQERLQAEADRREVAAKRALGQFSMPVPVRPPTGPLEGRITSEASMQAAGTEYEITAAATAAALAERARAEAIRDVVANQDALKASQASIIAGNATYEGQLEVLQRAEKEAAEAALNRSRIESEASVKAGAEAFQRHEAAMATQRAEFQRLQQSTVIDYGTISKPPPTGPWREFANAFRGIRSPAQEAAESVEKASETFGVASGRAARLHSELHRAPGLWNAIAFGVREFGVELSEAFRGQRGQQISTLFATIRRYSTMGLGGVAIPAVATVVGIGVLDHLISSFGTLAEKTQNAAAAAGMGTEEYSTLQRVLQLATGDSNRLATVFGTIQQSLATAISEPAGQKAGAFDIIFPEGGAQHLQELLKNPLEAMNELREKFQQLRQSAGAFQAATEFRVALGRGGFQELAPILNMTGQQFQQLSEFAKESGAVITQDDVDALQPATLATRELGEALAGLGKSLAELAADTHVIDFLKNIALALHDAAQNAGNFAREMGVGLATMAGATLAGAGFLPALGLTAATTFAAGPAGQEFAQRQADLAAQGFPATEYGIGLGAAGVPPPSPEIQNLMRIVRQLEGSAPGAVSPKGAVSEYQITQETAKTYGFDYARLHTDPAYAAQSAGQLLDFYNQKFHGNLEDILVAWNAGPGWVPKLEAAANNIKILPAETQKYLERAGVLPPEQSAGAQAIPAAPLPPSPEAARRTPLLYSNALDIAPEALISEYSREQERIRQQTQLQDAEYKNQIAAAGNKADQVKAIGDQEYQYQLSQAKRVADLYEQYYKRLQERHAIGAIPRLQQAAGGATALQREAIDIRTQELERQSRLTHQGYEDQAEQQRQSIADAQGNVQQIVAAYEKIKQAARAAGEPPKEISRINVEEHQAVIRALEQESHAAIQTAQSLAEVNRAELEIGRARLTAQVAQHQITAPIAAQQELSMIEAAGEQEQAVYAQVAAAARAGSEQQIDALKAQASAADQTGVAIAQVYQKLAEEQKRAAEEGARAFTHAFDEAGGAIEGLVDNLLTQTSQRWEIWRNFGKSLIRDVANTTLGIGSQLGAQFLATSVFHTQLDPGKGLGDLLGQQAFKLFHLPVPGAQAQQVIAKADQDTISWQNQSLDLWKRIEAALEHQQGQLQGAAQTAGMVPQVDIAKVADVPLSTPTSVQGGGLPVSLTTPIETEKATGTAAPILAPTVLAPPGAPVPHPTPTLMRAPTVALDPAPRGTPAPESDQNHIVVQTPPAPISTQAPYPTAPGTMVPAAPPAAAQATQMDELVAAIRELTQVEQARGAEQYVGQGAVAPMAAPTVGQPATTVNITTPGGTTTATDTTIGADSGGGGPSVTTDSSGGSFSSDLSQLGQLGSIAALAASFSPGAQQSPGLQSLLRIGGGIGTIASMFSPSGLFGSSGLIGSLFTSGGGTAVGALGEDFTSGVSGLLPFLGSGLSSIGSAIGSFLPFLAFLDEGGIISAESGTIVPGTGPFAELLPSMAGGGFVEQALPRSITTGIRSLAAGGFGVDGKGGQLIVAHPGEMVVPAAETGMLLGAIGRGVPSAAGGYVVPGRIFSAIDAASTRGEEIAGYSRGGTGFQPTAAETSPNVHIHLSAIDSRSGASFLMSQKDTIARAVYAASRGNNIFAPR